ncbi:MmyB family transcriptional regulator [Streptosporangium sp. LJ11]|uniref:MmyB family transcriptional regulator n=1 Tax=Streptosporangium sp. LJ11 TaxID=3436927 RepID=UPI003F79E467
MVGELSTRSEVFRQRWASHDVRFHRAGRKRLPARRVTPQGGFADSGPGRGTPFSRPRPAVGRSADDRQRRKALSCEQL